MPSDYRSASGLLNPNASLYTFHLIFHLDALPREKKGLSSVSLAPWRKDEGTSDRKDCICLVFCSIIYTLLSVVVAPADLISVLWVVTLLILAPDPGW